MQINLSHGEMFQRIFEGGLPGKKHIITEKVSAWPVQNQHSCDSTPANQQHRNEPANQNYEPTPQDQKDKSTIRKICLKFLTMTLVRLDLLWKGMRKVCLWILQTDGSSPFLYHPVLLHQWCTKNINVWAVNKSLTLLSLITIVVVIVGEGGRCHQFALPIRSNKHSPWTYSQGHIFEWSHNRRVSRNDLRRPRSLGRHRRTTCRDPEFEQTSQVTRAGQWCG